MATPKPKAKVAAYKSQLKTVKLAPKMYPVPATRPGRPKPTPVKATRKTKGGSYQS